MKKLLILALLMLALVITAVACTETPDEPDTSADEVTTAETPTEAPDTDEPDTPAPDTDEPETPAPDTDEPETPAPDTDEPETEEPAPSEPTVTLDKTEYQIGESIMISATGSDKDWVGIAVAGGSESIRWWYVADVGEGVAIDALNDSHIQAGTGAATGALPGGEYEVVWVANDQSLAGADKVYRYKFTIKDPSAPVLMLKPEDLNTLAGAAAPNVNQLGSSEVITEGSKTFVRWTAAGGDPYVAILPLGSSATLPQYMAISYRTNSAVEGQFFVGSGAGWTGNGDSFMVTWTEGDWSFVIVDLTQTGVTSVTDGLLAYARMDFFAGDSAEGDYFDVQYVGFFNTAEYAAAYDFEMNKAPMWDVDKAVVVHQNFDQFFLGDGSPDDATNNNLNLYHAVNIPNWDKVATLPDYSVETLTYWGWMALAAETVGTFGYQIDMDDPIYDESFYFTPEQPVVDAAVNMGGKTGTRFLIRINIAGLDGTHNVRVLYKDAEGNEVCLNEITVELPVKPTHYDNYNVPQDLWTVTGHCPGIVGKEGHANSGMVAAGGVESGALVHQGAVSLGEIDLSKYDKAVIMWGCDNSPVTVGHYENSANNRIMLVSADVNGTAPAEGTIIAGGTYELGGWAVQAFEIDLTEVDYNGPVYLCIDTLPGTFALFASVEFIGGEIDYSAEEPEEPEGPQNVVIDIASVEGYKESNNYGYNCPIIDIGYNEVYLLGNFDLNQYSQIIIEYSYDGDSPNVTDRTPEQCWTDAGHAPIIGFTALNKCFGYADVTNQDAIDSGIYTEIPYTTGNWAAATRTATIEIPENIGYNGPCYLSAYNPWGRTIAVASITLVPRA